ncbi:MAG TPA: carboxypeptidase-like regulatory domain-containing protein, partial [Candidatus Paceibacterota bacterium]|nr:carboxypeptidase-like regulatory domain-containing protein [Candidatus Paceibacterota bacterium]
SGTETVNVSTTTTFTISCTSAYGTPPQEKTAEVAIIVSGVPLELAPTVDLKVKDSSNPTAEFIDTSREAPLVVYAAPSLVVLSWTSTNADSCRGSWSLLSDVGKTHPGYTVVVGKFITAHTINCQDSTGARVTDTVFVRVMPIIPPEIVSCGDGVVSRLSEQCEPGEPSEPGGLVCGSDCRWAPPEPGDIEGEGVCGDNIINPATEECDGEDFCDANCRIIITPPADEIPPTEEIPSGLTPPEVALPTGPFPNTTKALADLKQSFGDLINRLFAAPFAEPLASVLGLLGLGLGLGGLLALFFTQPAEMFARFWNLLLSAFGATKQLSGVVFDSRNKSGLDPALVRLFKLEEDGKEKEVASAITTINGEYALAVGEPGIYRLEAGKTNYVFPSVALAGQTEVAAYPNLYFGKPFEVKREGEILSYNIPMDPSAIADWNEIAKQAVGYNKNQKRNIFIYQLSKVFFVFGFIAAIFALIFAPKPYNFIVLGLYCGLWVLRRIGFGNLIRKRGRVTKGGAPLPHALVEVFSEITKTKVKKAVTGPDGRFFMRLTKGKYYATISAQDPTGFSPIYTSPPFHIKRFLKSTFKL